MMFGNDSRSTGPYPLPATVGRLTWAIVVAWVASALFSLACFGLVAYVAWHFIAKVW